MCAAGASFGRWRGVWTPEEVADSRHVLDWIAQQAWSSGQVFSLALLENLRQSTYLRSCLTS